MPRDYGRELEDLDDPAPAPLSLPSLFPAQKTRDANAELDSLGDEPDQDPTIGTSETARRLDGDGTFNDLARRQSVDRETERGKGVWGSFYDAVSNTVSSMRNDPALRRMYTTPIEAAVTVADSPLGPGEATKGLARGYLNVKGSVSSGVEQFARSAGFDDLGDAAQRQAKSMRDIATSNVLKARVEALSKISKERWFLDAIDYGLSAVGEGIGSSASFGAAGVVGGLPGVLALGYTSSLGELREELKESGITDEQTVAKYAYLAAVPHSILDTLTERGMLKGLTAPAKKEVRRGILRMVMSGAAKEGVTEASQRVIELATVAHANGGEAPSEAVIASLFSDVGKGTDSTILESGVRGALPGAVFGGAQYAGQRQAPQSVPEPASSPAASLSPEAVKTAPESKSGQESPQARQRDAEAALILSGTPDEEQQIISRQRVDAIVSELEAAAEPAETEASAQKADVIASISQASRKSELATIAEKAGIEISDETFEQDIPQIKDAMLTALPDTMASAVPRRGSVYRPIQIGQGPVDSLAAPEQGLTDIAAALNKALGLTVRQGRLDPGLKRAASAAGNELAGQFSRATGVTRLALPVDLATLTHEGGHALEVRPSLKAPLESLKTAFADELVTKPAANGKAPQFAYGDGFSGLDLDADTLQLAREAIEADIAYRDMVAQVGAAKSGGGFVRAGAYDQAAYDATQKEAAVSRAALGRRLGTRTADAVIGDATKAAPADLWAYLTRRFAATGQPAARAPAVTSPTLLSEGFAEFFRMYLTQRDQARASAPRFFDAFETLIDENEPAIGKALHAIQGRVVALARTSPVGAVRSRVKSSVPDGFFARLKDNPFSETFRNWTYALAQSFVDAKHPMKQAVRYLLETASANLGPTLKKDERLLLKAIDDPYKLWRLAEHSKVHATAALQHGIIPVGEIDPSGPSFSEALAAAFGGKAKAAWSAENAELFGSYLVARRMLAEFDRYDKGLLEKLPDQVIARDIWQLAKDNIEKQHPNFKIGASLLYEFNRNALKLKLDNGFLTQELYDDLIQRPDYVPLNRIMDDKSPSSLGKSARGNNKRKLINRFQGSTRDFINPLESIAQDMYATQARIALNSIVLAMDRLARAAGPGGGAIAERIPASEMKATTMDLREAVKAAAKSQGLSQSDSEGLIDIIDDLFDQEAAATIFRSTEINERGEPIVYLWENGKKVPIRLGDNRVAKDIFDGLVAYGQDNSNIWIDMAGLFTQALRAGITKSPAYIIANFLRDQVATWILSEHFTPFITGAKGMKNVIANDQTAKRYSSFAGLMGGIDAHLIDSAAHKKDILTLRKSGFSVAPSTWGTILRTMEITEAASRFGHFEAAFERAKADGLTPLEAVYEAAYAAHDVLDFSRRGSKMVEASRIVAFLNASLQGLDAARRTITGERDSHKGFRELVSPYLKAVTGSPLSVAEQKDLPNSARFWIKAVAVGIAGVALAALYRDDPEYDEFDDQMRATHWFVKINGKWLRVPKPFELAFFSNLFEAAFAKYWKNDDRAPEQFVSSLKHTMIPPHEMNIARTFYEMYTGVNMFSHRPIVPSELKALPPEMQFTAYTSELGKMIGNLTGTSPAEVDHLLGGLFGTFGRDTAGLSDALLPPLNEALGGALPGVATEPRADKSPEDYWIVSRFSRRSSRGAISSRTFWDLMAQDGGEFTAAAAGYKALQRAGQPRLARDFADEQPDEKRAYAHLEADFKEDAQDLHPLNRARQVLSVSSGIRKNMVLGRLFREGTVPDAEHKYREPEEIVLSPSKKKIVNEILEDLSMREARNALVLVGQTGWTQKELLPTQPLVNELKTAAPELAEEFEARLHKGRNKVYSFEAIRTLWPQARDRLVKDGADAELYDLIAEAKALSIPE